MRVLHVYKDYPPVVGGIENHLRLLAEHQVRRGLDVTVLVVGGQARNSVEVERGVRVVRAARLGELHSMPLSTELFRLMGYQTADVTHLQFPYPLGEVAHLLRGRGRATVITYQSDIVRQRVAGWFYRPLLRRLLARADRIITTSPQYRRSSTVLAPFLDKCTVVPLGIEPRAWGGADPGAVAALRRRFPGPLVLFVGRLRYYKGVEYLLRAMDDLPATLLVVGEGPRRQVLERQARRGAAAERVHFLGELPQDQLPACYEAADVLVLPSSHRSEAFGLVLLEAMASRTAVISTELGTGTSFTNVAGETGQVVPPRDAAALAQALRACLADPQQRRHMGASGRARVESEFRVDQMVDGVLAVYEQALARTCPRGRLTPAAPAAASPSTGDDLPKARSLANLPTLAADDLVARRALLAILYSDLFEYPLTEDELRGVLVGVRASVAELRAALDGPLAAFVTRHEGFVLWRGREFLVDRRRARATLAPARWEQARRYARWLRRVPFVRLVAVCGSQAWDNAAADGDIDFFCLTAARRLWLVQVTAMLLRRLASRGGAEICPNYFLTTDALALEAHDLYTAHEALHVVPLWGRAAYESFQQANLWTRDFLPAFDLDERRGRLDDRPMPRLTRLLERTLAGRLGDLLDAGLHRGLMIYYRARLRRHVRRAATLQAAYRRDRQVVVGGGYAQAVAAAFRQRLVTRLPPGTFDEAELAWLFPPNAQDGAPEARVARLYGQLLAESYGTGR